MGAGASYWKYKAKRNCWPKVRGVAMNPVEHPHGGGNHQHIGMASTICRRPPVARSASSLPAALAASRVPPTSRMSRADMRALRQLHGVNYKILLKTLARGAAGPSPRLKSTKLGILSKK